MKQHEISVKTLNVDAVHWVEKLRQVLLIQDKGKGTVKSYTAEMMLPNPMPKVIIPFSLQMLQRTGVDYTCCPKCKTGKMEIVASFLNHNGLLVNIKDLNRRKTKNKSWQLKRPDT